MSVESHRDSFEVAAIGIVEVLQHVACDLNFTERWSENWICMKLRCFLPLLPQSR
jgi:hypothetical protein